MHDVGGPALALLLAAAKVLIAFGVGVAAVVLGVRLFSRWTRGIDEIQELRRGNVAVGVLLAAVVLAYTLVLGSGLAQITDGVIGGNRSGEVRLLNLVGGLLALAAAVTVASLTIRYALFAFSRVSGGIDQEAELRNRNVAVGLLLAGIIFGVSQVTSRGLDALGRAVSDLLIGLLL